MMYDKEYMSLFHRRILVLLFLIVFAISAPVLIFYAAGYRYNTRLRRIEQLGLLYVTTVPNGSKLSIDGQSYDVEEELVIDDLRAGSYDVAITKDGYHSWEKRLDVVQGRASFIRDLLLFKDAEAEPRELFIEPLAIVAKTPAWVIFGKGKYLFGFDRSSFELVELELASAEPVLDFTIDDRAGTAVFQQGNTWYSADFAEEKVAALELPATLAVSRIRSVDGDLFLLTPEEIWRWNGDNEPELLTPHLLAQDIYPASGSYWILSKDAAEKRTFLYELPSKKGRAVFLTAFDYADDIRIADVTNRFLTVHDADEKTLYLVDVQSLAPVIATIPDVHSFSWSGDHTELLTATDFEIAVQRLDHGKTQEVLTRLSTPILDAEWHAYGQHILYVTADGLFALERDSRDKRNVFHLVKNKADIRLFSQSPEGDRIFFSSTNNGSSYVIWEWSNIGL
jgi:hypothetical protein